jgi:hypothetical protein
MFQKLIISFVIFVMLNLTILTHSQSNPKLPNCGSRSSGSFSIKIYTKSKINPKDKDNQLIGKLVVLKDGIKCAETKAFLPHCKKNSCISPDPAPYYKLETGSFVIKGIFDSSDEPKNFPQDFYGGKVFTLKDDGPYQYAIHGVKSQFLSGNLGSHGCIRIDETFSINLQSITTNGETKVQVLDDFENSNDNSSPITKPLEKNPTQTPLPKTGPSKEPTKFEPKPTTSGEPKDYQKRPENCAKLLENINLIKSKPKNAFSSEQLTSREHQLKIKDC